MTRGVSNHPAGETGRHVPGLLWVVGQGAGGSARFAVVLAPLRLGSLAGLEARCEGDLDAQPYSCGSADSGGRNPPRRSSRIAASEISAGATFRMLLRGRSR